MMKTLKPNSSVILIRGSMVKTQNQTRMKIIMLRKNNHHHQYNENRLQSGDCGLRLTRHMSVPQSTGGGKKQSEALHISKDLSPLSFFMLYFTPVIDLLVMETNRYYHQYLDRHNGTPNPLPDITNSEIFLF